MTSVSIGRPAGEAAGRGARSAGPSLAARAGMRLWRLFTSVNFAVVQIVAVAVLAVFGMTIRQLPGFAFRSAADYATEMDKLRAIYEPALGVGAVDLMERLQLFHVFTSTPFSIALLVLAVSIFICTLDRTPRLWQQSAFIRVAQPDAYYDPRLPDRVSIAAGGALTAESIERVLRRARFAVRREVDADGGATYVYGDRNRWTKLATLISHLGLILFLVAGLVTARFGDEQGLVVAEGETLTVQPIGTPGLLLVENRGFEAPGLDTGQATDFTTDLVVYQDGRQLAEKTIRVNDPLTAGGYTFHQNGFGPAPDLVIRSTVDGSILWSGPVPLTDAAAGRPFGAMPVPGRPFGLELLLDRTPEGVGALVVIPYAPRANADGTPGIVEGDPVYAVRGDPVDLGGLDLSLQIRGFSEYTLLIAKRDPGAPIVWFAFVTLLLGLAITFYLPRRRVWARLGADGRLDLVGRADRQVDFDRELGNLVDALVAARATPAGAGRAASAGPTPGGS